MFSKRKYKFESSTVDDAHVEGETISCHSQTTRNAFSPFENNFDKMDSKIEKKERKIRRKSTVTSVKLILIDSISIPCIAKIHKYRRLNMGLHARYIHTAKPKLIYDYDQWSLWNNNSFKSIIRYHLHVKLIQFLKRKESKMKLWFHVKSCISQPK